MTTRHLTVEGRLDCIDQIIDFIGLAANGAGFDERTRYACQLAASEACENIIIHGYGVETEEHIQIVTHSTPNRLVIELIDSGPAFDAAKRPKARCIDLEDPQPGGLGLQIIHRVMDQVQYKRRDDKNILRMVKVCGQGP
jgi:serine/threonine-protein kinase RsbW